MSMIILAIEQVSVNDSSWKEKKLLKQNLSILRKNRIKIL